MSKGVRVIKSNAMPGIITKSEKIENVTFDQQTGLSYSVARPYDPLTLQQIVDSNSILPQCVTAYKKNIAGYGIDVKFKNRIDKEDKEAIKQKEELENIIEFLSFEKPTKEVFEEIIEDRERLGYAFLEVIRDLGGRVVEIARVSYPESIEIVKLEDKLTEYKVTRNGKISSRSKKFRCYKQMVNGNTVYFKEFMNRKKMNKKTGSYEDVVVENQANELIHFKINNRLTVYGKPRWEGVLISALGARYAEKLNLNYFINGRHTPMAILIKNGTLSDDAFLNLQSYMNDIKGEAGQHKFLLLEAERMQKETMLDSDSDKLDIEIKPLAEMLQKDELFIEYLDNSRKKIQSAFRLPDIYVGYTQDFNVATAKQAVTTTEQQVFVPERESLSWVLNNLLLGDYGFDKVEAFFKSPNMENSDQQKAMFAIASKSMTINQVINEYSKTINTELEPIADELGGNVPIELAKLQLQANIVPQITKTIEKAEENGDIDIVSVLKDVQKSYVALLEKIEEEK